MSRPLGWLFFFLNVFYFIEYYKFLTFVKLVRLYDNLFMKRYSFWLIGLWGLCFFVSFCSCGKRGGSYAFIQADSLNHRAFDMRYKNLDESEKAAGEALRVGKEIPAMKAQALNNLAFASFIRMDFERADSLLRSVYEETTNELECLVADVGMMKICQRTAMNKEFYDYRNRALRRMKRIKEDESALEDVEILRRFNYACSEFSITSAIYYYYLQQEKQSREAMDEIVMEQVLEDDTAQLLYYYYMKGSGGMYEADTPEEVVLGEFDYLMDCLMISHEQGYIYFEANASQAMAELLKNRKNYDWLMQKRPGMMRVINQKDLPWEKLIEGFALNALELFKQYGDWYQISGTYRTLASCCNEMGRHEEALEYLTEALSYVNLHHEKFYHCHDTIDRLKPYIPFETTSTELRWINAEGIKTVPEWIARFREQLSVTYAALGMKPQSDYNRNIYLDILDYTRQDKELESRYQALEKESSMLNFLLVLVVGGLVLLMLLMFFLNRRWRKRYALYVDKLKATLDICRKITACVPSDAEGMEDVVGAIMKEVKENILSLVGATEMDIRPLEEGVSLPELGNGTFLLKTSKGEALAIWTIQLPSEVKKEETSLLEVIVPYMEWTLENGLALISLGDERRRLEKEQYVHELHLVENKRQNLIKKACLFLVNGITPYIDRVVNEVHKLISFNYLADKEIKDSKYHYIDELITRINEYNDILALWIKMRQGTLSLNIENFELNPLFEVLQKSRRNFDLKMQTFLVKPTDVCVKADKALTLFMMNTLAENARKYTQRGGEVRIYACEEEDYVEISVEDNGPGLSQEDVRCILEEKVYDSGKIGLQNTDSVDELKKSKGSGFGLMNCKGIIEKYRKTNSFFRVCCFGIESRLGKGSRFFFRLPKGVRRSVGILLFMLMPLLNGCGMSPDVSQEQQIETGPVGLALNDPLLDEANRLANRVYEANLEGRYQDAIQVADSTLMCLNEHYMKHAKQVASLLQLVGEGSSAELEWFAGHFDTDYYTLLDVRNEAAVAFLALGELDAYHYNNQAYASLYKQISVDASLEEYCVWMQSSANNKAIALILCVVLLVALPVSYYLLYLRHRFIQRDSLEQVLVINRRALAVPMLDQKDAAEFASALVSCLYGELNELVSMDCLSVAVYSEEQHALCYAFSSTDEPSEDMKEEMARCYASAVPFWNAEHRMYGLPLCVEMGEEKQCLGVMAFYGIADKGREEESLMMELVANYVAIIVYNAVELVAQKYRDIEVAQDEARRIVREENLLHVQNMVLDNCLSTIKHETIYYPNRIKQIIDHLSEVKDEREERRQVETMAELIGYYKDVFTILASCASRQLEEVTFRRGVVKAVDLVEALRRYFKRVTKRMSCQLDLQIEVEDVCIICDAIQLKFLLENLVNEALACVETGKLELRVYREGNFVRFDFIDRRREYSQEELNQLFYPHLSRMHHQGEGLLIGTEYLVCKQIVRDHDEFAGRRGCRMNACQAPGGGFMVWFTLPAK